MLSLEGYIDGITASISLILGFWIGIIVIYRSKKINAKLLLVLGLDIIFMGLMFLGVFLDFIVVLVTGNNIINVYGFVGLVSYIWVSPILFLAIYIGLETKKVEKKLIYVRVYIIITIIFETILFIDPYGSFNFTYPPNPGELLIDYNLNLISLAGIFMIILTLIVLIFFAFTFYVHGHKTSGETKKKFFLLVTGVFIYAIFGMLESLIEPGILLIFIRLGYTSGSIFMYLGLREGKKKPNI